MNLKTKIHKKWDRELKKYLSEITWCEKCGARSIIDVAHRLKRRFIGYEEDSDRQEYFMAAKLCRTCHQKLDEAKGEDPHRAMFDIITNIIWSRNLDHINGEEVIHSNLDFDSVKRY